MSEDDVDFAVVAYREEGAWQVAPLPLRVGLDIDALVDAVRPWPSDTGALGFVSVDEDFFVLVRVLGQHVRALLSDSTAAGVWPIATGVLDLLDLPEPEDDEPQPIGDMDIVTDLGVPSIDLAVLCEEDELYPDEILSDIARRIGFGEQFEAAVESASV
ncbi:MAG: tRNA adenosine deaminase-associated protein [Nocardioidaceae bacterium]